MILFFLTSGLFLGWSLGANNAGNIFGTAVGSHMIRFRTAMLIGGVFVVLGAVFGGAGTTETLGKLGQVNALAGAFTVALCAAVAVYWMTRLRLPVSTSQAIVGGILGWNLYSHTMTNFQSLGDIVLGWFLSVILAGVFAAGLFLLVRGLIRRVPIHLLRLDSYTRIGLVLVGAFASYSLGANNIANVMGVFVAASPFKPLHIPGLITLTGTQQLFFLGGLAIAVGMYTYSRRVIQTVGDNLMQLVPVAALVVVLAESLVLFVFSSQGLRDWFLGHGLPALPLVPVSSSQAAVGAIVGIGLIKGGRTIRYRLLGSITLGWLATPVLAGVLTFFCLFFVQNVFNQAVFLPPSPAAYQTVPAHQPKLYPAQTAGGVTPHLLDGERINNFRFANQGGTMGDRRSDPVASSAPNPADPF